MVFVDLDPGVEQRAVQPARGVVQQRILDLSLQQQAHAHFAPRRLDQSAAKAPAWKEIGAGDDHLHARRAQVREIGLLDIAAMAHAVAYHERGTLRADRRRDRRCGIGPRTAAPLRPGHLVPELRCSRANFAC